MTAKEKAIELVFTEFRLGINVSKYHLKHDPSNLYKAKKCAMICVQNIISVEFRNFEMDIYNELDYWNEVKLELEKL